MKRLLLTLPLLLCFTAQLSAQKRDTTGYAKLKEMYGVNPWIEVPVAIGMGFASQQRLLKLQDKDDLTPAEIEALNPDDVIPIDRWALRQDFDRHKGGILISDYLFGAGQYAPFTLFIFKKYRQNWINITTMYLQAQATQGLFYGYAPFGPSLVDRYRPRVYYLQAQEEGLDGNQRNSMFSGHVSTMSTGFYFVAKMIDDHNPHLNGTRRAMIYTAATIPSVVGGIMRVRALKHYPTDVAVGLGVGAISGILVPQVHRWWKKNHSASDLSVRPIISPIGKGASFSLVF